MATMADLVALGPVYTGDPRRPWAQGVALRGDRVVAVGTRDDAAEHVGAGTRVVDAAAGLVVPGFQDAHVHAPFAGRNLLHLSLLERSGRADYLAAIARYAADHPERSWIVGGGWAMEHFPGGTPHRDDLDAVVPDRPVFLFNRDTHGAWVNSRALEIAGIDDATPDPPDGRYERDERGRLTGTLHEGAAYTFNDRVVPRPDRDEWIAAILRAQEHLHALGITGWQDAWVTPGTFDAYASLAADGRLTAQVAGALWWDRHRGLDQVDGFLAQRERAGTGRFRATSVKIMTDGVLENYTGSLLQPYCDGCGGRTDNHGLQFVEADLLDAALASLTAHGFQVHLHTIGDRAVRLALDAVEHARTVHGRRDLRHTMAHVQIVHPDDLPRFAALDVVANCQTFWAQSEPQLEELTVPFLGRERVEQMYPFGDLRRRGTRLAMGSDWPVTTADPLLQMEVAVTRVGPDDRGGAPFLPHQALPLEAALAGFTRGAAYVNHDDDAGVLEVGRRADVVVLDRNPFDPGAGPIGDTRVRCTVAGGVVVHDALG